MTSIPRFGCSRLVLGALLAALMFGTPAVAHAHGRLKSSAPGSGAHLSLIPRELRLEFSEVPDLTFSTIALLDDTGKPVALGTLQYSVSSHRVVVASISSTLRPGTYVVQWQLAGDDGHPVRGRFDFVIAPGAMLGVADSAMGGVVMDHDTVVRGMVMHHDVASMPDGEGFGVASPAFVVIRWLQFIAMLLTIGAVVFRQLVLRVLRREQTPDSPMLDGAEARAARIGHIAVGILALTLLLRLLAQSYAMHGAAGAWNVRLSAQMIAHTMWGKGWLLQLVGLAVAGVGFQVADRARRAHAVFGHSAMHRRTGWLIAAIGVVILAFSPAVAGHAASVPGFRALGVLADALHILAASGWLGSLTLVLTAGLPAAMALADGERGPMVAALINAFSPVALASAAVVTITGVFAAWLHVGHVPNLWGTRYGITLLVKLGILGVVALTGFYNWRFVQPTLGTDAATVHLRRSARVEVAVAILVLLVTAVLVATPTSMDMVM